MGQMPFGQVPPQPKRSRTGLVVGIIITVVVLLALIVAGAALLLARTGNNPGSPTPTPTAAAAATSSIPAGFAQYSDAGGTFSLNVPSDWSQDTSSSVGKGVIFKSSDESGIFEIVAVPGSFGSNAKSLEDGYFQGLSKGVSNGKVQNSQGPTTVSQGGESWTRESADITSASNSAHAVVTVTTHSGTTYLVAFFATSEAFSTLDTQDFEPMFTSFQFTS